MYVDSHCHLHLLKLDAYQEDLATLIRQNQSAGVDYMLCVATSLDDSKKTIRLAEQYADISASVGVHPSEAVDHAISVQDLVELAKHPEVVAIGETGLDYYYHNQGLEKMRLCFRQHIQAAKQVSKPLIIHSRAAREDTIRLLREEDAADVKGVMHCFTETWDMAKQAISLGFYISISGIITFKNAAALADVVKKIPLNRLLIETDAPFLAPVPYRGKQNEPKYVRFVAEKIAELKKVPVDLIAEITTQNFRTLFSL